MTAEPANPYQAPADVGEAASELLPPAAVRKATNLIRDARLAFLVGLIPLLGLIVILRLLQWHLLRKQYPILVARDEGEHAELAKRFRAARSRLWFAVLLWAVVLFAIVYLRFT